MLAVEGRAMPLGKNGSNVLTAFDKLFKIHYVLNVHYDKSLTYFYNFMEAFIYKMPNVEPHNCTLALHTSFVNCDLKM